MFTSNPGGFGGVTITKSITIDAGNIEAGVLVSGTNAPVMPVSLNGGYAMPAWYDIHPDRSREDEAGLRRSQAAIEELLARMNALVRRSAGWSKPLLECGPVKLDTTAQSVTVHDQSVDLTSYEYKVLEYLILHAGELVSKSDLTEHIYEQDFDRDSNVIEVFIGRLRKKLDPEGEMKPIETVRGRGYRFAIARTGDA